MAEKLPNIDFRSIRPLNGSQRNAFEELGTQLFFGQTKKKGEQCRIEGAGGDGGVEAYREHPNGKKIGFQAKYFNDLKGPQWRQITESVKTAIQNHPELVKYVIAVPFDRNPTNVKKWKELKTEWHAYAAGQGVTQKIKFKWWGYSKLADLLIRKRYRNLHVFWFGLPEFTQEWIDRINQTSIAQLDKRYSPKQHIETESGRALEAFAWGDLSKQRIQRLFASIEKNSRKLCRSIKPGEISDNPTSELAAKLVASMSKLLEFSWPPAGYPKLRPFGNEINALQKLLTEFSWKLRVFNNTERQRLKDEKKEINSWGGGPFDYTINRLQHFEQEVSDLDRAVKASELADDQRLLLLGEAGTGKSHIIADAVQAARGRGQLALFLLGEAFTSNEEPWTQALRILGWNHSVDDLLGALDEVARVSGRPALLCIDALNESDNRKIWKSHLLQFQAKLASYPHVKVLVSCRSDFVQITLPEAIRGQGEASWPALSHYGFGSEVLEAVECYFTAFNISSTHFPPALSEFRNPLFLRVFCEAFEGRQLPEGPLTLEVVMKARVERLCQQVEAEIDCDTSDTKAALNLAARAFAEAGGQPVARQSLRTEINKLSPRGEASRSLFRSLVSNGILVETIGQPPEGGGDPQELVRFPFERFSDYFVASEILENADSKEKLKALFSTGGQLEHLTDLGSYLRNRGLARALSILIPERFGIELAEILESLDWQVVVLEDFLDSFPWRGSASFSSVADGLIEKCYEEDLMVLQTFLRVSMVPGHPYNSSYLGEKLTGMKLPEREWLWTIPISELSSYDENEMPSQIVDWSIRVPAHLISNEQAELVGRVLLWFCTSNHRELRTRASLAAIRILAGRPEVVQTLIEELHNVDDPYLVERLYAVAAGVAMRETGGQELEKLAETVYSKIFAMQLVPPNILVRDYARCVLETAQAKGSLPEGIAPSSFLPPYKSDWPLIISEEEAARFDEDDGWRVIVGSVKPEGMGLYGDFGRYVMGSKVHKFSSVLRAQVKPGSDDDSQYDDRIARRWILQRVEVLGWTPERYGEYESQLPSRGRQRYDIEKRRLERISKKYQWIALRELQGFLSDHYWLSRNYWGNSRDFEGAWQIWAREFDPSQPLLDLTSEETSEQSGEKTWLKEYDDPFQDYKLCIDREKWVTTKPEDFAVLLRPKTGTPDESKDWLTLSGHYVWEEPEFGRSRSDSKGRLQLWADVRSILVPRDKLDGLIEHLRQRTFYGFGCGLPEFDEGWIGEYPWGGAFKEFRDYIEDPDPRVGDVGFPCRISVCQVGDTGIVVPSPALLELLGLEWSGDGGKFRIPGGEIAFAGLGGGSPSWEFPAVVELERLSEAIDREGLSLIWCVTGEKSCYDADLGVHIVKKKAEISALYYLTEGKIKGGIMQFHIEDFQTYKPSPEPDLSGIHCL